MTNKATLSYSAAVTGVVMAAAVLFASVPAFALENNKWHAPSQAATGSSVNNDVSIVVSNSGTVSNTTSAKASTGGNWAGGSFGGHGASADEGGNGGNATAVNAEANGGMGGKGGNGGNGGMGGPGGLVDTGDAASAATTMNMVNSTEIDVEQADCGCDESVEPQGWYDYYGYFHAFPGKKVSNKVDISVSNSGSVSNDTRSHAKTGHNDAVGSVGGNGGEGDEGGNGGNATAGQGKSHHNNEWYAEYYDYFFGGAANGGDAGNGGHGGNGGDAGEGGTIRTGDAMSQSDTTNVVNTTVIRTHR